MHWTNYDGKPRNYVQILKRYQKYPVEQSNVISNNLNNAIYKKISDIIVEKKNIIDLVHVKQ